MKPELDFQSGKQVLDWVKNGTLTEKLTKAPTNFTIKNKIPHFLLFFFIATAQMVKREKKNAQLHSEEPFTLVIKLVVTQIYQVQTSLNFSLL